MSKKTRLERNADGKRLRAIEARCNAALGTIQPERHWQDIAYLLQTLREQEAAFAEQEGKLKAANATIRGLSEALEFYSGLIFQKPRSYESIESTLIDMGGVARAALAKLRGGGSL